MSRRKRSQKKQSRIIIGIVVLGILGFVAVVMLSSSNKTTISTNLTYNQEIQPILDKNCVMCHGPNGGRADLPFNTYQGVMRVVKPSDTQSPIVIKTQPGGTMSGKLSSEEADIIKAWVSQGAKE